MDQKQTIYIELLNEGVSVYRPIEAIREPDGAFRLPPDSPEEEQWRFTPGSRVHCEWRDLSGTRTLVADRLAP